MRNRLCLKVLAAIALACGLAACGQTVTSPTDAVRNSAQAKALVARPFSGPCTTVIPGPATPPEPLPWSPPSGLVLKVVIRIFGECNLTHLGNAKMDVYQALFGPPDIPPAISALENFGTYTAANGDVLNVHETGSVAPGADPGSVVFSGTAYFQGGTGRFSHASGSSPFEGHAQTDASLAGTGYFVHQGGTVVF